jgi:transposase-like protein
MPPHPVARHLRPDPAENAQACRHHGRCRARRAGLHDIPQEYRVKLRSINPIARLNGKIKRRAGVVGIFPNVDSIVRLVGALLLEQNDE